MRSCRICRVNTRPTATTFWSSASARTRATQCRRSRAMPGTGGSRSRWRPMTGASWWTPTAYRHSPARWASTPRASSDCGRATGCRARTSGGTGSTRCRGSSRATLTWPERGAAERPLFFSPVAISRIRSYDPSTGSGRTDAPTPHSPWTPAFAGVTGGGPDGGRGAIHARGAGGGPGRWLRPQCGGRGL